MIKYISRLAKSFLVGVAASFSRSAPTSLSCPPPIEAEAEILYRSEADCRVRTIGSVRYTYAGPMIGLDQGGILNPSPRPVMADGPSWGHWWTHKRTGVIVLKTVLDRDFRNRCIEGTGWDESET